MPIIGGVQWYVYQCTNLSIYLILSEVDLTRHVSCEVCDVSVSGGYDSELNQVRETVTLVDEKINVQ